MSPVRRSERLADQNQQRADRPSTIWTASKPRKTMLVNGRSLIVPSSIQAVPSKGLIDKPLIQLDPIPLSIDDKDERLRAYHARLDLMQTIINPDHNDYDWQVETITDWTTKSYMDDIRVMLKVTWIGGDKQ